MRHQEQYQRPVSLVYQYQYTRYFKFYDYEIKQQLKWCLMYEIENFMRI